MTPEQALFPSRPRLPLWEAGLAVALAVGSGVLLAELLLAPPAADLRSLAGYLSLSAVAATGLGWLGLRLADRLVGLGITARAFLGAAVSAAAALLNILIVAQLMFVSTGHDLRLLLALLASSAVVSLLFSTWSAATVVSRLRPVTGTIGRLAAGDYNARAPLAGRDEITRLAGDVNRLAERLQAIEEERRGLDRERRELTAAISHDLRTPLASVQAMAEALDDGVVADAAEVARYYVTMRREIERLSGLLDDLFELARMDAGATRLERRRVALGEIAYEVVDGMQARARLADVTLGLRIEGTPQELMLDGARVERAVANLVSNALEHTQAGGQVEVLVQGTTLRVRDTGEGIASPDLPRVWERFYRGEKSRSHGDGGGGAGLGLAIVRAIVEAHGGSVEARSSPGAGSTFAIHLRSS